MRRRGSRRSRVGLRWKSNKKKSKKKNKKKRTKGVKEAEAAASLNEVLRNEITFNSLREVNQPCYLHTHICALTRARARSCTHGNTDRERQREREEGWRRQSKREREREQVYNQSRQQSGGNQRDRRNQSESSCEPAVFLFSLFSFLKIVAIYWRHYSQRQLPRSRKGSQDIREEQLAGTCRVRADADPPFPVFISHRRD